MRTCLLLAASFASSALASASGAYSAAHPGRLGHRDVSHDLTRHVRRRALRSPAHAKRSGKCKPRPSATATGSASQSSPTSSSGSSNSSSSSGLSGPMVVNNNMLTLNNINIGMLPDGGSDGGEQDTMATLNGLISSVGKNHHTFGQYAQAQSGTPFTGGQLTQVMSDLLKSGAVFEPAVMPTGGWDGLTWDDNSQAVNICNVMKQFTDQGIQVRLRFAHEANWYLTDGTYSGTVSDFIQGFDVVANTCAQIAPEVVMFWTPNIASLSTYETFAPNMSMVGLIGADYYPTPGQDDLQTAFLSAHKAFHDQYCTEGGIQFAIGETGLGAAAQDSDKMTWLQAMADAKTNGMPYLISGTWFNYQKGYDFKICDPNDGSTTSAYISTLQGNYFNNNN